MDLHFYEQLAPPGTPNPWLAVIAPGTRDYVIQIAESKDAIDLRALEDQWSNWIKQGYTIEIVRDDPTLRVRYCSGLYTNGWLEVSAAVLAARRNWFLRYRDILDRKLADPLPTLVQLYERRPMEDIFGTMRSTRNGPFPFPSNADWPRCGECGESMAFIGVLDFRAYCSVGKVGNVPAGALVLHGCDRCTIPCTDDAATSLTWITAEMRVEVRRGPDVADDAIEVGRAFKTIEFPTPALGAEELSIRPHVPNDPRQATRAMMTGSAVEWGERDFDQTFTCPLTKVGGHLNWIQNDETPNDRSGRPMQFIGQFIGSRDVDLGDSGIAYIFFSDETRETNVRVQFY